jgi:hypothetical protein
MSVRLWLEEAKARYNSGDSSGPPSGTPAITLAGGAVAGAAGAATGAAGAAGAGAGVGVLGAGPGRCCSPCHPTCFVDPRFLIHVPLHPMYFVDPWGVPRFLSHMASYDPASDICQALLVVRGRGRGRGRSCGGCGSRGRGRNGVLRRRAGLLRLTGGGGGRGATAC